MKWYEGKNSQEIYFTMHEVANKVVGALVDTSEESIEECSKHYDDFMKRFNEVIPVIVDMKTEYWAYKHVNSVYDNWKELHENLIELRADMCESMKEKLIGGY